MFTVIDCTTTDESRPVHESRYVVCSAIALVVLVFEVPVQLSVMFGLSSVTVHALVFVDDHVATAVRPDFKSFGVTWNETVGGGGATHAPLEQA